jgi:signal transduction histidine kinase
MGTEDSANDASRRPGVSEATGKDQQRARERRAAYLGFVAHEARNPLSTALWTAELMARLSPEERAAARGEKLAAMCMRALARLRLIVEDHFLAERLDAGGIPNRPDLLGVAEVIAGAVARRPAEAGPCEVKADPDVGVVADRMLFEKTVEGLLAAAGRGGAAVKVEVGRVGDRLVIRFLGAPPLDNPLADPDKATPTDPKGRPLALAMAVRASATIAARLEVVEGGYELSLPATDAVPEPSSESSVP